MFGFFPITGSSPLQNNTSTTLLATSKIASEGTDKIIIHPSSGLRSGKCDLCFKSNEVQTLSTSHSFDVGIMTPDQIAELIRGLNQPTPSARVRCAKELGKQGMAAKNAFPFLVAAVQDPEQVVREAAVQALGTFGSASVPSLIEFLAHTDKYVRRNAVWSLNKLGQHALPALSTLCQALRDADPRTASGAAQVLGNFGVAAVSAVPALVEAMRGTNVVLCRLAAKALSQIGRGALPSLILHLKHHDPFVRGEAAMALGWMGPDAEEAVPSLIELLGEGRHRQYARAQYQEFGHSDTITPVGVKQSSTNQNTLDVARSIAAQALGRIGPGAIAAVPELIAAVEDPCEQVRFNAEFALRQIQMHD